MRHALAADHAQVEVPSQDNAQAHHAPTRQCLRTPLSLSQHRHAVVAPVDQEVPAALEAQVDLAGQVAQVAVVRVAVAVPVDAEVVAAEVAPRVLSVAEPDARRDASPRGQSARSLKRCRLPSSAVSRYPAATAKHHCVCVVDPHWLTSQKKSTPTQPTW